MGANAQPLGARPALRLPLAAGAGLQSLLALCSIATGVTGVVTSVFFHFYCVEGEFNCILIVNLGFFIRRRVTKPRRHRGLMDLQDSAANTFTNNTPHQARCSSQTRAIMRTQQSTVITRPCPPGRGGRKGGGVASLSSGPTLLCSCDQGRSCIDITLCVLVVCRKGNVLFGSLGMRDELHQMD